MRAQSEVRDEVLSRAGRYRVVHPKCDESDAPSPLDVKEVYVEGRRYIVCRNQDEARKDAADREAIVAGVIAPVPGIMRLFWAFSSSNPPESPSQEDSSLANMLDTLEARCRSDGPPAGPRSIDPLPGSRSFLTVSAVA